MLSMTTDYVRAILERCGFNCICGIIELCCIIHWEAFLMFWNLWKENGMPTNCFPIHLLWCWTRILIRFLLPGLFLNYLCLVALQLDPLYVSGPHVPFKMWISIVWEHSVFLITMLQCNFERPLCQSIHIRAKHEEATCLVHRFFTSKMVIKTFTHTGDLSSTTNF